MAAVASRNPLTALGRQLMAALNAWSYAIARARAERRRRDAVARSTGSSPLQRAASPRWPSSWGD